MQGAKSRRGNGQDEAETNALTWRINSTGRTRQQQLDIEARSSPALDLRAKCLHQTSMDPEPEYQSPHSDVHRDQDHHHNVPHSGHRRMIITITLSTLPKIWSEKLGSRLFKRDLGVSRRSRGSVSWGKTVVRVRERRWPMRSRWAWVGDRPKM